MPHALLSPADPPRITGVEDPLLGRAEVLAVPLLVEDDLVLGPGCAEIEARFGLDLLDVLESLGAGGAPGEVTRLPVPGHLVLAVGVGPAEPSALRKAGAALGRACRGRPTLATTVPAVAGDEGLAAFVAGLVLGSFRLSLADRPDDAPVEEVLLPATLAGPGLERAIAIATASWRSRWLATVPANIKNPPWLADQAVTLAESSGLTTKVWDEEQLAASGFGGLVAVGQASDSPPRLVQLGYEPEGAGRRTPHVVLVGKGITFDTGGLSIKPGEAMVNMKRDMTGAAVVTGVMAALPALGCQVRVTGLLACAENSIGAAALRPGDVIRHYGGITTEVTNTDAEGRLVLADALAYAVDELEPDLLVDIATLTGAMKVALGLYMGGYFATDDAIAGHLEQAAADSGEPLWRMPLVEEYAGLLSSRVADLDNSPEPAKAITAALFLQRFTAGLPWAHLDVASIGDTLVERDEWTVGPTGFGARVLLHWLTAENPLEGISR